MVVDIPNPPPEDAKLSIVLHRFLSLLFLASPLCGLANVLFADDSPPHDAVQLDIASGEAVDQLRKFLRRDPSERGSLSLQPFASKSLTKKDAEDARRELTLDSLSRVRNEHAVEMKQRVVELGDLKMPFAFQKFGKKPKQGRSLYISLHGGGGTEPRVNDQQWENQKRLYRLDEGIYVAPRAPTNTWNLWHQAHIDPLLRRLIEMFVAFEDVDWNRVYLLGYSAGGDGVYQLAPRMADCWAAAAMMAGHPNETSPLGLRNVPFALQVGELDSAYRRNDIAGEWKTKLAKLQASDPAGYRHFVKIHPNKGHWMNREDAIAIPWMAKMTRNAAPPRVVWKQDDVTSEQSYWLMVDDANRRPGTKLEADIDENIIRLSADGIASLSVLLDDRLVDLDKNIRIEADGKMLFEGLVNRTIAVLSECMDRKGDPNLCYTAAIKVAIPPISE